MRQVLSLIIGFLLILTIFDPAFAAKKKTKKPAVPLDPVMTFHIVRKSDPLCEPTCPQWIAAEGRIESGTASRLRQTLKALGKTKLPIIISFGGGDLNAALEMARLIREKKLTVAVGTTFYVKCNPKDKTCKLPPEQKSVYRGFPSSAGGYCYSACPFVLAGGVVRMVSSMAQVGVHQITYTPAREWITYRETYKLVKGKKKVIARKEVSRKIVYGKTTHKLSTAQRQTYRNHFKKMGVDVTFLDLLDRAGPKAIYVLKPDELNQMRIRTTDLRADVLSRASMCTPTAKANHCVAAPKP